MLLPAWHGDSIDAWDGDILVVDTIRFNDRFWFDAKGRPHTDQLPTLEPYTRQDLGTRAAVTTITAPVAYQRPFKIGYTTRHALKGNLMEYICAKNNQHVTHITTPAR